MVSNPNQQETKDHCFRNYIGIEVLLIKGKAGLTDMDSNALKGGVPRAILHGYALLDAPVRER